MKLIEPSVELWKQRDLFKHIEKCGRICYKSEDKITEDSATKFIDRIIKSGHTSVLEHGTIYLTIPIGSPMKDSSYIEKMNLMIEFEGNNYSFTNRSKMYLTVEDAPEEFKKFVSEYGPSRIYFITTNYRVIIENNLKDIIVPYITDYTKDYIKRITAHIICDRGVLAELTRHRVFSFSVESTRYCNYSKDKFGGELTFIKPYWLSNINNLSTNQIYPILWNKEETEKFSKECGDSKYFDNFKDFMTCLATVQQYYNSLLKNGCKPQEARAILPNCLKTELAMTGTIPQWEKFFKLRCDKNAHPDMQIIANKLKDLI